MSSITRSHAVHTRVTAPLRAVPLTEPMPGLRDEAAEQGVVAERVSATAHVAAGAAGVDLTTSVEPTQTPAAAAGGTDAGTGLRFLGAGWAADAAVFAQYRRRGN
ncbi:hypothetical protein [uncultured Plantibacter sp.]|uniref:hypothetical protein n=1 Tax=uncultured Plantibacter sp. TaxID=293337 RepID=UPI0028D885AF|nr:hypothetical protein [uncultured Plantibacter sp.]